MICVTRKYSVKNYVFFFGFWSCVWCNNKPPEPDFRRADIRQISVLLRSPPDGFSATSRAQLSPHWPSPSSPSSFDQWGERCALETGRRVATANGERDATATSRKIHPEDSGEDRISGGYPPSGNRVLPPVFSVYGLCYLIYVVNDVHKNDDGFFLSG